MCVSGHAVSVFAQTSGDTCDMGVMNQGDLLMRPTTLNVLGLWKNTIS